LAARLLQQVEAVIAGQSPALTEAQVLDGLRLDAEAIAALRACSGLRPPRNAVAIVGAIKARLEWSQPKPKQQVEHSGHVTHAHLVAEAAGDAGEPEEPGP